MFFNIADYSTNGKLHSIFHSQNNHKILFISNEKDIKAKIFDHVDALYFFSEMRSIVDESPNYYSLTNYDT